MEKKLIHNNKEVMQGKKIYSLEFLLTMLLLLTIYIDMSKEGLYYSKFIIIVAIFCISVIKNKDMYFDTSLYTFFLFLILVCASGLYGLRNDVFMGNMATLICCLIILVILPSIINTKEKLEVLMDYIIILGVLLSLYTITLTDYDRLMQGTYYASNVLADKIGNRNAVALLIGFAFSLGIYKILYQKKYKNILFTLLMLIAILLTGSRKGLLICIIPAFINLLSIGIKSSNFRRRIKYLVLLVVLFIASYYVLINVEFIYANIGWRIESIYKDILFNESSDEGSYNLRKSMIQIGLEYFKERPLLGYGLENYRYLYGWEMGNETYSHNNYVEILVNNGIIGLLLYYSFYISIIIKANKKRIKSKTKDERNYYVFCMSLLICMLIIDWGLVSYQLYLNYIIVALSLKRNWN